MRLKRNIAMVAIATLAAVGGLILTQAPAQAVATGPAIFFTPHQDDESLSMGANILAEHVAGRQVIVVDVTDGSGSKAFGLVNTRLVSEGYAALTKAQFVQGRYNEQAAAVNLHLARDNASIVHENYIDNTLTVAQATTTILKYVALYPDASFKTESWLDLNPDHIALGTAMRNLCNTGQIPNGDCRFEQFRRYWTTMPIAGSWIYGNVIVTSALAEYKIWNPSAGRYAIGWTYSVPQDFIDATADGGRDKVHKTLP